MKKTKPTKKPKHEGKDLIKELFEKPKKSPETSKFSQKDIDMLIRFDSDVEFGPSSGITRLDRYFWAKWLGLDPPIEVYKFLTENEKDLGPLAYSYWNKYFK